jgi:hypothetical protein
LRGKLRRSYGKESGREEDKQKYKIEEWQDCVREKTWKEKGYLIKKKRE